MRLGKLYTDLWNAGEFVFNGGVTPVVGVGGNILGGGRGFLGRKYGYAIDQVSDVFRVSSRSMFLS